MLLSDKYNTFKTSLSSVKHNFFKKISYENRLRLLVCALIIVSMVLVSCDTTCTGDDLEKFQNHQYRIKCDGGSETKSDDAILCLTGEGESCVEILNVGLAKLTPESGLTNLVTVTKDKLNPYIGGLSADCYNDVVKPDLLTAYTTLFDGGTCIDSYSFTISGEELDPIQINSIPLVCPDDISTPYIVTQEVEDSDFKDLYVCLEGKWYNEDDFKTLKKDGGLDIDGDGVSLWWDCDENNPTVFGNMTGYTGWESMTYIPKEVCGDKVDNMCLNEKGFSFYGWLTSENPSLVYRFDPPEKQWLPEEDWLDQWDGTSELIVDNCHENPTACESNCLKRDNKCDYLSPKDPDYSGSDPNAAYEYIEEGYCCGADQIDDVGRTNELDNLDKVCLSNNDQVVGSNDLDNLVECGSDEYCWVSASVAQYKIFSIKILGQDPYDLVSNGNKWYFCNSSNIGDSLPTHTSGFKETSLRFKCFDQGDRISWAECVGDNEGSIYNEGIKRRRAGDGLYMLADSLGSPGRSFNLDLSISNTGGHNQNNNNYKQYYETDSELDNNPDFTGYDFLEFYVQFGESAHYPANVLLTIYGPNDETIYFKQNTLGFAVNSPQVDGDNNTVHIKVPIEEWINVRWIQFDSTGDNNDISIKNVFLSKNDSEPEICSGFETAREDLTSWISDLDFSQSDSNAIGKEICKNYYGDGAWFGHSDTGEVAIDSASCCGDDPVEYYVGNTGNNDARGCFNGEVVRNDDTMMNIEYSVSYHVVEYNVTYPDLDFSVDANDFGSIFRALDGKINAKDGIQLYPSADVVFDTKTEVSYYDQIESAFFNLTIYPITDDNVKIHWFITDEQKKLSDNNAEFRIEDYPYSIHPKILVETEYTETSNTTLNKSASFNFPCTQEECTYGLPGSPPYTITNIYPHLYDLYFVNGSQDEDEYLITTTTVFNTEGNVRAKKVSKQILYTADEDDHSFWGCSAGALIPSTIFNDTDYDYTVGENFPQCSTKGSYYCAYQDENFLINSWSQTPLSQYGYESSLGEYEEGQDFELASCDGDSRCLATSRNQSTSVVPGRNFITNPSFTDPSFGDDIPGWDLLNTDTNQFNSEEDGYLDENTMSVPSLHSFRTEKIALMQNKNYYFSNEGTCSPSILLVNSDGDETNPTTSFNSLDNIFVIISFQGSCTLSEPMLQLIDDLGINSYNNPLASIVLENPSVNTLPKGAACCPESWCWNGFICVESMDQTTFLHEDINNRTYRCIDGTWSYLNPKFDWNHDEWGFCNQADQCFVTSSFSEGADPSAIPEEFYGGKYSTCINNTQYIFDHYCNAGTWVSRTSFLVSSLLTYAENDDYTLSCDRPQINLLNYDDPGYGYKNYIVGSSSAEVTNVSSLTDALNGTPTQTNIVDVCFNSVEVSETGKRLVPTGNTCINNVCVLRYNSGGEFKTAFGTSMNLQINDSNSFLVPLEVATGATADEFCIDEIGSSSGNFVTCNENLKYSSKINSLIYSREELSISPSVISKATEWFKDFFTGDEDEETEDFLLNSVNYNKVYLTSLNDDRYIIRSVEDVTPDGRRILSEYSGFDLDVCDYVLNINEEYVYDPLYPDSPEPLVVCNVSDDDKYLVSVAAYTEFWWPQLTGMLRIPNE